MTDNQKEFMDYINSEIEDLRSRRKEVFDKMWEAQALVIKHRVEHEDIVLSLGMLYGRRIEYKIRENITAPSYDE